MADDLEEFRKWQGSLEGRVSTLEATVRIEAGLRAKMDEDLGDLKVEFRAQRRMLQALHDTQQEHTARFEAIDGRLEHVEGRLENVDGRLGAVEGTLQKVNVGVQAISDKLDRLINMN